MSVFTAVRRLIGVAGTGCALALASVAALAASQGTGAATAANVPSCRTSGLVVWLDTMGGGYAGGTVYDLQFTNLSGVRAPCSAIPGSPRSDSLAVSLAAPPRATRSAGRFW